MRLSRDDIVIRDAEAGDAAQLAEWWNDGGVMAHAGFPHGLGISAEEIAASLQNDSEDSRRLIIEKGSVRIGEMNYRRTDGASAEIGVKICRSDYQDRGTGSIVLSMLIRELFSRGFQKIVLDTNIKNGRAQHVYEKLGFVKKRVNVDAWEDQDGVPQTSVDYELAEDCFKSVI